MRDDDAFGELSDEARDVLVALVSCGGHVAAGDLLPVATAWAAANGRALDAFDAALDALAGSYCHTVAGIARDAQVRAVRAAGRLVGTAREVLR